MFLLSAWLPLGCWTFAFRHRLWQHHQLSWLLGLQMGLETAHQLFCWISKMLAIALGPLHLQSCMSQFLLENPSIPLHSPGHFYDLHWAVITSSHALFLPDWSPWGMVCIWFVSGYPINAALLRQSLKVMVPSEELIGGKADGESSFFICSPGRAVTPLPSH